MERAAALGHESRRQPVAAASEGPRAGAPPVASSGNGGPESRSLEPRDLVAGYAGPSGWAYRTRRFRILGYDFAFRSSDEGLGRYLDDAFDGCPVPGEPTTWYSVMADVEGMHPYLIFRDKSLVMSAHYAGLVPRFLTWDVNRRSIEGGRGRYVILHAGAVARGDTALLLPASMEAGKTTLVAGLLRAGFEYLTDEAAAVDHEALTVEPFPKPLSLDPGSWPLFPEVLPRLQGANGDYASEQWQVSPHAFGARSRTDTVAVSHVIFPRYVPGAATEIRRIAPTASLTRLLEQTFDLREHLERNLLTLGRLVEHTAHYELTIGALDHACQLISEVFEPSGSTPGSAHPEVSG